ncbi:hypothetical protein QUF64_09430 [Anaerolineales bacterium HSG6]|nr:hypothetical protein [Anaerolineales bacterium HSG6]
MRLNDLGKFEVLPDMPNRHLDGDGRLTHLLFFLFSDRSFYSKSSVKPP